MNFAAPQSPPITVSRQPAPGLSELAGLWSDLESRADGSFFTSWVWVGSWLATFAADGTLPEVTLIAARAGNAIVGLGVIGTRDVPSLLGARPVAALHQTGVPEDDAIFIEYNDFLLDRRHAGAAREAMLAFIAGQKDDWREFRLSGVTSIVATAAAQLGLRSRVIANQLCPWVNLAHVPGGLSGYLGVLSRNTRQKIQRSLRLYEQEGEIDLSPVVDEAETRTSLADLSALHKHSWNERKGHGGAFVSARFVRFADRLVTSGNLAGKVQLLRASAGGRPFGYLLNFVHEGHVYAYQSGFVYRDDNRYRPGLVAHALAVAHAREQGLLGYHFMAGDGRYKSSLANAEEQLLWIALRHDDLMSRVEDGVQAMKAGVKKILRSVSG